VSVGGVDELHSQLLRYADDLRVTYAAERRRSEELGAALAALEQSYIATVRALATAVEAKDSNTGRRDPEILGLPAAQGRPVHQRHRGGDA